MTKRKSRKQRSNLPAMQRSQIRDNHRSQDIAHCDMLKTSVYHLSYFVSND
ncbi:hypothetical protein [Porphyromonas pogonae]|uniref:hypothetical protein n=1 Tax=Porphyromonas pogonae TaxID=867595 RepID=UPI002E794277|nr:hypothetical protein [Porphyromonas pogonae]